MCKALSRDVVVGVFDRPRTRFPIALRLPPSVVYLLDIYQVTCLEMAPIGALFDVTDWESIRVGLRGLSSMA